MKLARDSLIVRGAIYQVPGKEKHDECDSCEESRGYEEYSAA
jgi:hypothetical protein